MQMQGLTKPIEEAIAPMQRSNPSSPDKDNIKMNNDCVISSLRLPITAADLILKRKLTEVPSPEEDNSMPFRFGTDNPLLAGKGLDGVLPQGNLVCGVKKKDISINLIKQQPKSEGSAAATPLSPAEEEARIIQEAIRLLEARKLKRKKVRQVLKSSLRVGHPGAPGSGRRRLKNQFHSSNSNPSAIKRSKSEQDHQESAQLGRNAAWGSMPSLHHGQVPRAAAPSALRNFSQNQDLGSRDAVQQEERETRTQSLGQFSTEEIFKALLQRREQLRRDAAAGNAGAP